MFEHDAHSHLKGNGDEIAVAVVGRNFGWALSSLKKGTKVAHQHWHETYLYYVNNVPLRDFKVGMYHDVPCRTYGAHIDMRESSGDCGPWGPTQADLLAEDWIEIS